MMVIMISRFWYLPVRERNENIGDRSDADAVCDGVGERHHDGVQRRQGTAERRSSISALPKFSP